MIDYVINPIKMGGLVKEVQDDQIKVHLHGRLGVITVPRREIITAAAPAPGQEMEFYFSYIQVNETPWDYDSTGMEASRQPAPCLLGGTITEVNDTAVKVEVMDGLGTIAVPRRWVFTPVALECGLSVEFYFSCMKMTGQREIPVESI